MLEELCIWLAAIGGSVVSQTMLWRAVQALDWRRKKVRPRRRARHCPREGVASRVSGSRANQRCYLFQVRG
jgi:hypothetical protein